MNIIPSIDLIEGACVRLTQGDFLRQTTYSCSPVEMAKRFKAEGAQFLHVVDLLGAKDGAMRQLDWIKSIVDGFGEGIQAGGGIRTKSDADALFKCGVSRVVIGTQVITHQQDLSTWIKAYGVSRLVFAYDFKMYDDMPYVMSRGWQTKSPYMLWDLLSNLPDNAHVVCTDVGQDGMQQGPNVAIYQDIINRYPKLLLQASGGVSAINDIRALKQMKLDACIIGKALYEGCFQLAEALLC